MQQKPDRLFARLGLIAARLGKPDGIRRELPISRDVAACILMSDPSGEEHRAIMDFCQEDEITCRSKCRNEKAALGAALTIKGLSAWFSGDTRALSIARTEDFNE